MRLPTPAFATFLAALGLGAAATSPMVSASGAGPHPPPPAQTQPAVPFDAAGAWQEFTELLRLHYGYFSRPGVDGDAILAYFEPQARAAKSKAKFRDVLQVIAHNFADPHFIVGPLDTLDYNVVPTVSDLAGRYRAGRFELVDVRRASDAEQQGIEPGTVISRVDGLTPQAAVETALGRPLAMLSPVQIDAGLNLALAGRRRHSRRLTLAAGAAGPQRIYTLRSPGELAKRVQALPPLSLTQRGEVAIIRLNNSLGNNETIAAFRAALQQALAAKVLVLDLRNTPSGGNTTVARGVMGHFVRQEKPYQIHVVPSEERQYGVPRKFVEYVLPIAPYYPGKVVVLGGRWTGSMGEGLLIGFHALGIKTAGSELADLLGALFNERLTQCDAQVDLGEEQLLQVNGQPREDFVPALYRAASEGHADQDALLEEAIRAVK